MAACLAIIWNTCRTAELEFVTECRQDLLGSTIWNGSMIWNCLI